MRAAPGFFDVDDRLRRLSDLGDQLEAYGRVVDFEAFRPDLEKALGLSDRVPDARTIWLFRERLTKAGAIQALFERFDAMLCEAGYIAMLGQIVDSSLIAAPKQRKGREGRDQG